MANPDFDDDKTQSFVALTADTRVSHYEIIDKIGADEIGEVYLAEDTSLDREVAPKFFPAPSTLDHDFMSRFVREAEAATIYWLIAFKHFRETLIHQDRFRNVKAPMLMADQ